MNKQEKIEYLKTLGVNFNHKCNVVSDDKGLLNGFFIYPSDTYYFVINGKFPLDSAEYIFNTYSNEKYHIRVDGGCEDWKPIDRCTSDEFENYIQSEIDKDIKKFFKECKTDKFDKYKNELINKDRSKFYIASYHIDTISGLKIVVDYIKENNIYTQW